MSAPFNISARRVGGLTFVKIGRLTFSFSVSRRFRPFKAPAARTPAMWRPISRQERAFRLAELAGAALAAQVEADRLAERQPALWPAYADRAERQRMGV